MVLQHPRSVPLSAIGHDSDPLPASPPSGPLVLYGFSSTLHTVTADNLAAAQASTHLLPWSGETVDRYDVRLLLEEQSAAPAAAEQQQRPGKRKRHSADEVETEEETQSPDASDDDESMLAEDNDRASQREAPLRDELSSGEWRMADLEWERYRDLQDEDEDEMEDEDVDASVSNERGTGRQWQYNYKRERQQSPPLARETQWRQEHVDPVSPPSMLRPSSPPPPPFKPPFPVPLHIQLVHCITSHMNQPYIAMATLHADCALCCFPHLCVSHQRQPFIN